MRADFEILFESMNRSLSYRPTNLPAALESLPPVDQLPRPWSTWLYIVLGRHRLKQERAWAMVKERLPHAIPPSDELLERFHKEGPPLTIHVPGGDRWVLDLECRYMDAFLSKQGTGEGLWISLEDDQHGGHKIDLQPFLERQDRQGAA